MRPEYIAMQAALLRGFADHFGINLPDLTDPELVGLFQTHAQPDYFEQKRQQWNDPAIDSYI